MITKNMALISEDHLTKEVWKYRLTKLDQKIEMPEGAVFLDLQIQDGTPCIWALVNPKAKTKSVGIEIYYTGTPIPQAGYKQYLGTFQSNGLVYHVFQS